MFGSRILVVTIPTQLLTVLLFRVPLPVTLADSQMLVQVALWSPVVEKAEPIITQAFENVSGADQYPKLRFTNLERVVVCREPGLLVKFQSTRATTVSSSPASNQPSVFTRNEKEGVKTRAKLVQQLEEFSLTAKYKTADSLLGSLAQVYLCFQSGMWELIMVRLPPNNKFQTLI